MDAIQLIKLISENYKEIGATSASGLLSIGYIYHKFLQKRMDEMAQEIKQDQKTDGLVFESLQKEIEFIKEKIDDIYRGLHQNESKFTELGKELEKMIAGLEAHSQILNDTNFKISLNENSITTLKNIVEDALRDVREMQKQGQSLEVAFAKMLGTISRNYDN